MTKTSRAILRNKEQSMGISLTDAMILEHSKIDVAVRDLAESGFEIIRPFLRHTHFGYRSPETVSAIGRMTHVAHKLGCRVVLDCEPHSGVAMEMGRIFPGSHVQRIVRASAKLINGRFVLHVRNPPSAFKMVTYCGVKAAWLCSPEGELKRITLNDLTVDGDAEIYDSGFSVIQQFYQEGRLAQRRMHTHLRGSVDEDASGSIIVYAAFEDNGRADFWSEGFRKFYDLILDAYRDVALDGISWDEPATCGDWDHYLSGTAFERAFEERHGQPFSEILVHLDACRLDAEVLRARIDYYQTLNEGTFRAQENLILTARRLFGSDILLGTHHTWQGEGNINDYRSGAVDYFRLNDSMDAGYTDCCWWDPASVIYAYTLASSLGRLTPSGEAEVNTWHWKATNEAVGYNARLITLFNVNWFNIFYGEASEVTLYPSHYTWSKTVRETIRNRDMQRIIGNAEPLADVAILHSWEGVCAINRADIAAAHKAFCLNQAELFFERNIPFDWIDCRLMESASIKDEFFITELGNYRILILPHAAALPRKVWNKVLEFVRAKGKAVFVGCPPTIDTDGKVLTEEFAALLGMTTALSVTDYLSGIDAVCELPRTRPKVLEVTYPIIASEKLVLTSVEGVSHGLRSPCECAIYMTDVEPGPTLVNLVSPWLDDKVVCLSDSIYWRLYRNGERWILVVAAKRHRMLRGLVQFGEACFEFKSGTVAVIEKLGGNFTVTAEEETTVDRIYDHKIKTTFATRLEDANSKTVNCGN